VEEGYLNCLEYGFEIFSQSISGLEFSLDQLERRITQSAITQGYDGLSALAPEIKKGSETERALDEVQGVMDAASLERKSAEVFRRAQSKPEQDKKLEFAFCDWVKFVGGNSAVRFRNLGDFPEGIVEFRPDQLPKDFLQLKQGVDQSIPDRIGTFRRSIAQERPDLEFFSVGNEFFDAICSGLYKSTVGRSYAVECQSNSVVWRGFEFSYRPFGNRNLLNAHPGLMKHLDRIFAVPINHCFIREDLKYAENTPELLRIRKSLTMEGHNRIWHNFTLQNNKVQLLANNYAQAGWGTLVTGAEGIAREKSKEFYKSKFTPVFEAEHSRIEEQIRQARTSQSDGWEDEIEGLEALQEAISGWYVELDTAGFLSVNGGLIL
jgi:hypothetical protein